LVAESLFDATGSTNADDDLVDISNVDCLGTADCGTATLGGLKTVAEDCFWLMREIEAVEGFAEDSPKVNVDFADDDSKREPDIVPDDDAARDGNTNPADWLTVDDEDEVGLAAFNGSENPTVPAPPEKRELPELAKVKPLELPEVKPS
jgi:hypothetical protein